MSKLLHFELPSELIAQEPARPRDHARLLVYDRVNNVIHDDYFYNLKNYLHPQTTLVVNNSKVEHCRLLYQGSKTEIFILDVINDRTVTALVRPGKRFRKGNTVALSDNISVTTISVTDEGVRTLTFSESLEHPDIEKARHIPLPPYIKQNDSLAAEYQTVFAKDTGSKAAPTAGLHFTPSLKQHLQERFGWAEVTLHVGLGTFASLTEGNIKNGTLHEERYEITKAAAQTINNARHITAVGTTTVRTLESAHDANELQPGSSTTDIFIRPGYTFKCVGSLITNFHLPGTSLLLLVAAFLGSERELMTIYSHAIRNRYRFYSFGDAMLII
jgi:S-adenosylmethionine:tRNA ribosyltransferase-isomerase